MTPIGEASQAYAPAGFWRRVLAGLCDGLLLLTMAMAVLLEGILAVSLAEHYAGTSPASIEEQVLLWVVLGLGWCLLSVIVLPMSYFTICEGACGQTLGKRLFHIAVVSAAGQPLSYGRALARLLVLPYSLLPAGLGLLWAALSPTKLAWHDYITATRVILQK